MFTGTRYFAYYGWRGEFLVSRGNLYEVQCLDNLPITARGGNLSLAGGIPPRRSMLMRPGLEQASAILASDCVNTPVGIIDRILLFKGKVCVLDVFAVALSSSVGAFGYW